MANEELLKEIGLGAWETKTYLALLQLGSSTSGPIVEKSQVPRSKIYDVLKSLMAKGLVSYIIKGQVKYFQASNPRKILDLLKEKERQVENMLMTLSRKEEKHSVELFEGMKAIRAMCLEMVNNAKKGEEWYGFSTGTGYNSEVNDFYHWMGTKKTNAGIKDHLLITLDYKKEFLKGVEKNSLPFVKQKTRYSNLIFPGDVGISRDRITIFNWEDTPVMILIVNKNMAKQYKDFFLGIWKVAKK